MPTPATQEEAFRPLLLRTRTPDAIPKMSVSRRPVSGSTLGLHSRFAVIMVTASARASSHGRMGSSPTAVQPERSSTE